jgi:tripartite-type tricarboxylate transporter receptor subunit TctC
MRLVALVAISIGGVLWASPAFAYGPNAPTLTGNTTTVGPGGTITLNGTGFQPGETVTLQLFSTPVTLGASMANSQGAFTTTVTIPANTTPGNHTIVATGNTSGATASFAIVVTGASATGGSTTGGASSGGSLAFTGADIAAMAGIGAIALALGGMLVFAGRRRRVTASQS